MVKPSCNGVLHKNFFVGKWDLFSTYYPSVALEYIQHKTDANQVKDLDHSIVFYWTVTNENIFVLHEYEHLLESYSYVIIILAPHVKIHIFDGVVLPHISIHLVVQQGGYCVYEQDIDNKLDTIMHRQIMVSVYDDATVAYYVLYSGTGAIVHNYYSDCRGENAQTLLRGIFCATGNQMIKVTSVQRHTVAKTHSDVLLKGFGAHNASVYYTGKITIDSDAVDTIARQEHKTLLLSNTASGESIPILEVLNKEVQCFHASAFGMLDKSILLYMQSRGLSRQRARQIFLASYLKSVYRNDQIFFNIKKKLALLVNSFDLV